MGLIYEPLNQNFFAAMLDPLLDAGEVRVGAVTARQVLLVESRVLADQVAVGLVDVGKRPQLAGFTVVGTRRRMSFFVLSFPFSNMGFAQDLPHHLVPRISTAPKVESSLCRRPSTRRGRYAWGFSVPYTTMA